MDGTYRTTRDALQCSMASPRVSATIASLYAATKRPENARKYALDIVQSLDGAEAYATISELISRQHRITWLSMQILQHPPCLLPKQATLRAEVSWRLFDKITPDEQEALQFTAAFHISWMSALDIQGVDAPLFINTWTSEPLISLESKRACLRAMPRLFFLRLTPDECVRVLPDSEEERLLCFRLSENPTFHTTLMSSNEKLMQHITPMLHQRLALVLGPEDWTRANIEALLATGQTPLECTALPTLDIPGDIQ